MAVLVLQATVSLLSSVQTAAHLQKGGIKVIGLQGLLHEVFHILFCRENCNAEPALTGTSS